MHKMTAELSNVTFTLDTSIKTPLHKQICHALRESIISGALQPGQKVPGIVHIAKALNIPRGIVDLAFEELNMDGFIISKRGAGSFVSQN